MASYSRTLARKIPWMEEPGRLQSMGLLRVGHNSDFTFTFHFHALEKAMATHSSTLASKIPWMEESGRLRSMGSLRVGHDWATSLSLFTFMHWRRKWQPTPVFLPGESQGRGSLVAAVYGVAQSWTRLKQLSISISISIREFRFPSYFLFNPTPACICWKQLAPTFSSRRIIWNSISTADCLNKPQAGPHSPSEARSKSNVTWETQSTLQFWFSSILWKIGSSSHWLFSYRKKLPNFKEKAG